MRTKHTSVLPVDEVYRDGSFRSRIYHAGDRYQTMPIPVRAIEYQLTSEPTATSYRLITSLLDAETAPALELAALYAERWEIESAFDELKTHQRGPRLVLRSKTPDGARQEVWAYLCEHYAIRHLMHTAATTDNADRDRLSSIRSLRVARRTTGTPRFFPPDTIAAAEHTAVQEILEMPLPNRRHRSNPRVVKRKMSNYPSNDPTTTIADGRSPQNHPNTLSLRYWARVG